MIFNKSVNDGQINTGSVAVPKWTSITVPDITSISSGGNINNISTSDLLIPGMSLTPGAGTYLVSFNAEMSGANYSQQFTSGNAKRDLASLYSVLIALPGVSRSGDFGGTGTGDTLLPGIYNINGNITIHDFLTLDGGTALENPIFVIRCTGTLATAAVTKVNLLGNAKTQNIFWVSDAATGMGADTIMKGTMISGGTAAGADFLGASTILDGRMFSIQGAVSLGDSVEITAPIGRSTYDLGVLSTFVMWGSDGAVSDTSTCKSTGDVGNLNGALTMTGTRIGNNYAPGSSSIISTPVATSFTIYNNGIYVPYSTRTINLTNSIINLNTSVTVNAGQAIDVRWKVDQGQSNIGNRTLTIIRSGN